MTGKTTKLVVIDTPELKSLGTEKSQQIRKTFEPMTRMLAEFETRFNELDCISKDEIDQEICDKAKRLRLSIRKVRTKTNKLHQAEKKDILIAGRAVDAVKNILVWAVTEKENRLEEIENHFLIIESNRLDALKSERENMLLKFTDVDPDTLTTDLRLMEPDVWEAYLNAKIKEKTDRLKAEHDAEKARIEAEKKRIADDKKMRADNERLRLEAVERQRLQEIKWDKVKADQEKAQKEQAEKDALVEAEREKERKEYEKKQAEIQKENEKQAEILRLENEKKAKIEREKALVEQAKRARESQIQQDKLHAEAKERQKIQAELDAKKEAERVELERFENEKEALKKAGDKGAMAHMRKSIADVIDEISETKLRSKTSKQTVQVVKELLNEAWTKL